MDNNIIIISIKMDNGTEYNVVDSIDFNYDKTKSTWKIDGKIVLLEDFVINNGTHMFDDGENFSITMIWKDNSVSYIPKAFAHEICDKEHYIMFHATELQTAMTEGQLALSDERLRNSIGPLKEEKEEECDEDEEVNTWGLCDMFGTKFEIGDYITYPTRNGSWMDMRVAKVKDILGSRLQIKVLIGDKLSKITIDMLDRVIIIPKSYVQNKDNFKKLIGC